MPTRREGVPESIKAAATMGGLPMRCLRFEIRKGRRGRRIQLPVGGIGGEGSDED